ncbi:MAG TPA: trigger factor [Burkholderiales bacterium]
MAVNVESLGALERRVRMSVGVEEVERQVADRLKNMARTAKMPGFRPGKVPFNMIAKQYANQVRGEVLGDAVQRAFSDVVKSENLRVAGYPKIEKADAANDGKALEFNATFEVYPEVKSGDLSGATIERPAVVVDDAAIDRTIEILRKQRTTFVEAARAAQAGDRVTVDFEGMLDGAPFEGGKAAGFAFVIGEGRMLPEFEAAATGLAAGATKAFDLKFPDDYQSALVAGKTTQFTLAVTRVEAPQLPAVDAEFAKSLGVADGSIEKMRADIRGNVEREVKKRTDAQVKNQAMKALMDATPLELPKSLVEMETQQLVQRAQADLEARGMKMEKLPFEPSAFEDTARRRVALGLIIGELGRAEGLQPKPAQLRSLIEREAQSYERPDEVVRWFYTQPERLSEMEGLALENNVVDWVLSKAKVTDKTMTFDELMGSAG